MAQQLSESELKRNREILAAVDERKPVLDPRVTFVAKVIEGLIDLWFLRNRVRRDVREKILYFSRMKHLPLALSLTVIPEYFKGIELIGIGIVKDEIEVGFSKKFTVIKSWKIHFETFDDMQQEKVNEKIKSLFPDIIELPATVDPQTTVKKSYLAERLDALRF